MTSNLVWIIDDDKSIRWVLDKALSQAQISTRCFENGEDALDELESNPPQAVLCDVRMPGIDGLSLLAKMQESYPQLPVIIMTAHSDLDSAVSAYQGGAFEYLPKPFDIEEAVDVTQRALAQAAQNSQSPIEPAPSINAEIIGEAPAMQEVFRAIGRLSQSNITVLINGASGTGKELVAKALHRHSPRKNEPFIALNMAAIPKDLIESELFGHEKGAFTGAASQRQGRFLQADKGTLFLDEIGDMPADAQTRLLRVLADGEFYRVGGHTPTRADVRVIAATHQNLEKLVAEGRFREDLFHRLNVIRIHIPSLSERREDIPQLAKHFLRKAAAELAVEHKVLAEETISYIRQLPWPGNVRQLENACRWLTVMASGREVKISDLPPELIQNEKADINTSAEWFKALEIWAKQELENGQTDILKQASPRFEKTLIEVALRHTRGRKRDAAELLGWGRNTLTRKLKELKITA